jgi:hypothetical protein
MPDEGLAGKYLSAEIELGRELKSKGSKYIYHQTFPIYEQFNP